MSFFCLFTEHVLPNLSRSVVRIKKVIYAPRPLATIVRLDVTMNTRSLFSALRFALLSLVLTAIFDLLARAPAPPPKKEYNSKKAKAIRPAPTILKRRHGVGTNWTAMVEAPSEHQLLILNSVRLIKTHGKWKNRILGFAKNPFTPVCIDESTADSKKKL